MQNNTTSHIFLVKNPPIILMAELQNSGSDSTALDIVSCNLQYEVKFSGKPSGRADSTVSKITLHD